MIERIWNLEMVPDLLNTNHVRNPPHDHWICLLDHQTSKYYRLKIQEVMSEKTREVPQLADATYAHNLHSKKQMLDLCSIFGTLSTPGLMSVYIVS